MSNDNKRSDSYFKNRYKIDLHCKMMSLYCKIILYYLCIIIKPFFLSQNSILLCKNTKKVLILMHFNDSSNVSFLFENLGSF